MRKLAALPILFLALSAISSAQTTYTTTATGCGAKNLGYCQLSVTDQSNVPYRLVLDARYTGSGQINTLTVFTEDNPYTPLFAVHGAYSGFVPNPDGTKNAYYGSGDFLSDDGKVDGEFSFFAFYVKTCSGRGCGGTLGWHYQVIIPSTVEVK